MVRDLEEKNAFLHTKYAEINAKFIYSKLWVDKYKKVVKNFVDDYRRELRGVRDEIDRANTQLNISYITSINDMKR